MAYSERVKKNSEKWAKFKTWCRWKKGYAEGTIYETVTKLRYMERHGVDLLVKENILEDQVGEFIGKKKREGAKNTCLNHYVKAINRWCEYKKHDLKFPQYIEYYKDPDVLTIDQVNALINFYSKRTSNHKRNKLIILLFVKTGIRLGELVNIKLSDINWKKGTITVYGKSRGGKQKPREIPIPHNLLEGETYPSIKNYINHWRLDTDKKYLFTSIHGKLTEGNVWLIVKKAGAELGIPEAHPHCFRHYFITTTLRDTNMLFPVSKYVGHKDIRTTARYLHLIEDDLRKLINHPKVRDPLLHRPKGVKNRGFFVELSEEIKMGPPRFSSILARKCKICI